MNLLPKIELDFAQTKYWDTFFKKRGSKEFEWYGEFSELFDILKNYIKIQDDILVVGCGNSMLSINLYDNGYRKITNIDTSSVVIKQMKSKVGKKRKEMIFDQMDALNMSYDKEIFSVVLDKGTLDALMPSNSSEDETRAKKLFSEVKRVLKLHGRYIIISLLQKHILEAILDFFMESGWMIRILRCWNIERKYIRERGNLTMPVFMVVCVKFTSSQKSQSILEVNCYVDGKSDRISNKEDMLGIVGGIQRTTFHFQEVKDELEVKFCKHGDENSRYTIYITDVSKDQRKLLKYAAFIVPHGRETEWMFGCKEGRNYLRESSGYDRLACITFHRHQHYGSLLEVQDELRQTVLQLAPPFMAVTAETPNIPYLTLADGVGHRETVFTGVSKYSGDLLVEDVKIESQIFRRLIFLSNQAVVQSEVKMKNENGDNLTVDTSYIASQHILYMTISAAMKTLEMPSPSIAVIGVGGGALCVLLHDTFPQVKVTGVEIDPLVVQLGEKYFGLKTDERFNIVVGDGIEFLKKETKFDIIMYDVDNKERGSALSCPPTQFVELSILKSVAESLQNTGIFVINVVSRMTSEHNKLIEKIRKYFSLISWYNLKEDVNRIIFASNKKDISKDQWKNGIKKAALTLEKTLKEKLPSGTEFLDLDHLLANLKI